MVFLIYFVVIMGLIFIPVLLKYHGQHVLPFPNKSREALLKYFDYYQNLDSRKKVRFEKKVHRFMRIKKFVPRRIEKVTIEMKHSFPPVRYSSLLGCQMFIYSILKGYSFILMNTIQPLTKPTIRGKSTHVLVLSAYRGEHL
jgi:hypothetical protein